ncbi:hypothetical protein [Mycolicibacterium komossense]|uniref:Uncharacterized protein n=1 Tax=Mycolicibacterium komossense TaxID=1779 RepID=A0ABT3C9W6_9MYCO|nr:hypothetical protein [Mycolicibacterium komossense]MCV7226258.1 hypothetical protein [Mycolicibacterium komossense]
MDEQAGEWLTAGRKPFRLFPVPNPLLQVLESLRQPLSRVCCRAQE